MCPRDEVFASVLNPPYLKYSPMNILQVGAIEKLELMFRYGSGWSDLFFASYIQLFGGSLTIVDVDENHLENSKKVLSGFNVTHTLIHGDAKNLLEENPSGFDLIYLDGSNHPDETKDQYDLIDKDATSIILIDDYSVKGTTIKHDDRYTGQLVTATQQGIYVGINEEALTALTGKIENPREKVLEDLKVPCFQ